MTALAILVALGPLTGPAAALAGARARLAGIAQAAGAALAFGCSLALLAVLDGGRPLDAWDGFLYVDSLGGFFLMIVAAVTLLAAVGSISYVAAQEDDGELSSFQIRLYFSFFGLFASLMLAALETGNLGLLFVLVEASTLASAALVGLEGRARSLEAAWKYVIISSLGVTIALAGTLFLFYSGSALHLGSNLGLTWPYVVAHAHALAPQSLRLAFLLAVGSLTLAGLPPTVGFVSEWFLLESLMQQFRVPGLGYRLVLALAGAAVALTVGFAGVTFVRLVGLIVLGGATAPGPAGREYGVAGRTAIAVLALGCLATAAITPLEIRVIAAGLSPAVPASLTMGALKSPWILQPVFDGFSILSPSWLWVEMPLMLLLTVLFAWAVSGRRLLRVRRVPA
jgi:formate hydrogenlyase subunit 3/multisubunit Na+/H+ antiporter MnhD subunit